jgi:hypothetical protein
MEQRERIEELIKVIIGNMSYENKSESWQEKDILKLASDKPIYFNKLRRLWYKNNLYELDIRCYDMIPTNVEDIILRIENGKIVLKKQSSSGQGKIRKVEIANKNIILVDMWSGTYHTKHEEFNLERNTDGNYYGYIPPRDTVHIEKIDSRYKNLDYIDDVIVVYVKRLSKKDTNRVILAFHENARVFRKPQSGEPKNRLLEDGTYADYYVESKSIHILDDYSKFVIDLKSINPQLFRRQRCYFDDKDNCEKLDKLKQEIFKYLSEYLEKQEDLLDEDDEKFQFQVNSVVSGKKQRKKHKM